jgi:hypothetical protein
MCIQRHPLPLRAAEDNLQIAVQLGEDCLSTWPRSGSYEFRSPAICWLAMPQGHSHETTELKLLFLNEGYATCKVARQTGVAFFLVTFWLRRNWRFLGGQENEAL